MLSFYRFALTFLCLITALYPHYSWGQTLYQHPDVQRVKDAVQQYFAAESCSSPSIAQRVYHDIATFTYVANNHIMINSYSASEYLKGLALNEGVYENRKLVVDTIDISGNLAAVNCDIIYPSKEKKMKDFLTLIKDGEKWKIIHRLSYKETDTTHKKLTIDSNLQNELVNDLLLAFMKSRKVHDSQLMRPLFHPLSDILHLSSSGEEISRVSLDRFMDFHSYQKNRRLKHRFKIPFIYVKGNIALAKIQTEYKHLKTTMTEYFSLVLMGNEWKIVKKLSNQDTIIKAIIL